MDLAELLTVETSVLRTLCLTVNSESSELKKRITEALEEADFYFPITKSIYGAVTDLARNGTNVDPSSLQQALSRRSVDVPDDFFLEDLFAGEAPSTEELSQWLAGLHTSNGDETPSEEPAPSATPSLAKTHPSVKAKETGGDAQPAEPTPPLETQAKPEEPPAADRPEPAPPAPASTPRRETAVTPSAKDALSSEGGEWLGYLAELTKKQGEHFKTGFSGLDAEWGGLGPGLLLLAGEDRARLLDFLKQLVDQVAIRCRIPCLYLSFERSKGELRLQTLSRLSEAPSSHIREGRYAKDSAEWQSIIRAGEQAVDWLQRIYVVEATPGLAVTGIRELRTSLVNGGAGPTCMIAVDNLQKLASKSDLLQSVAELKELAESLGIVVIGVADNVELVHERSADMAVKFTEDDDAALLEVHVAGTQKPTIFRFDYRPEIHQFDERL